MESNNLISGEKTEKKQDKSFVKYGKIKYNKNIKKRINININYYKEYLEKYSSIEIEIKPINKKFVKFINIKNEEEKYYNIF